VEECHPLGRLFDLDVILPDGKKMERRTPRSCLVCGREGFFCASSRAHPIEEIRRVTQAMLCTFFAEKDAEKTATLAVESLKEEVHTTPKPGLVDERNNGSHRDMDLALFEASADALKPYFRTAFLLGIKGKDSPPDKAFSLLREAGKEAEKVMFSVTDGVNTHKGAIFTLGLICGALGRLWTADSFPCDRTRVLETAAVLVTPAVEEDFARMTGKTVGERLYLQEGIEGVRGEAKRGFPTVAKGALPLFEALLQEGLCRNAAAVKTLLFLIAETEDTNLLSRGGKEGAEWAKKEAKKAFLAPDFSSERVAETDRLFIEKNLSPGGSADLLALVLFLSRLGEKEE
jgi:holo-ACP synthase/triphosphoribosyl-dephospho-CoA synthase